MDLDPAIRVGYRIAHALLRGYWFVRRPRTSGALVAVWHRGELLIIESSYRKPRSLPGGYVRPGEDPQRAASRELREELNVHVPPSALELAYHGTKEFEFRRDTLDIYECVLDEPPDIEVDAREVVWAGFLPPERIQRMHIVPHLAEYLEACGYPPPGVD